jgi:hypothetical protein
MPISPFLTQQMERQALLSWSIVALHVLDVNTFFENSRK